MISTRPFAWLSLFSVGLHGSLHPAGRDGEDPRPEDYCLDGTTERSRRTSTTSIVIGGRRRSARGHRAARKAVGRLICKSSSSWARPTRSWRGWHRPCSHWQHVWAGDNWQVHFRDTMRGADAEHWRMPQRNARKKGARIGCLELERWAVRSSIAPRNGYLQRDFGGHLTRAWPMGEPATGPGDDPARSSTTVSIRASTSTLSAHPRLLKDAIGCPAPSHWRKLKKIIPKKSS